jgi:heptosyltransferase I
MPRRAAPGHLLIVLLTGIGDVVNALPLANALKRAWPASRLSWAVEPPSAPLLAAHPAVDGVIVYRKRLGWRGVRELWREMRGERFDLTLNLMPYFKSNWPTLFSRAPERWTFGRERARDGVWLAGNRRLPAGPRRHTLDMFLEFAYALGIDPHPLELRLDVTPAERLLQARLREQLAGRRGVAVVLTSANRKKDWPAEHYVPVVDAIQGQFGARAILLGGAGERERAAARLVAAHSAEPPLWLMESDVRSLVWVQDACAATVAPDTGPMHIARAVGTPVVALFGHTNPWRTGPYRAFEDLWIDRYTEPGTPPDPSNFTPRPGRMEMIEPGEVIARIARALQYPRG